MTKAVILVWCTCLIWAQAAHLKSADIGKQSTINLKNIMKKKLQEDESSVEIWQPQANSLLLQQFTKILPMVRFSVAVLLRALNGS
jgi:hypothetical protein